MTQNNIKQLNPNDKTWWNWVWKNNLRVKHKKSLTKLKQSCTKGTCQSQGSWFPWLKKVEGTEPQIYWHANWNGLWSVWSFGTPLHTPSFTFPGDKENNSFGQALVATQFRWSDAWGTAGACRWRLVWTRTRSRHSGMPVASLGKLKLFVGLSFANPYW